MGYGRAKKDREKQAIYDTYASLPSLPIMSEWEYGQIAFPLQANGNPKSPMSGVAVYDVEKVKATPKSVIVWAIRKTWQEGTGIEPKFPYRITKDNSKLKLIYRR